MIRNIGGVSLCVLSLPGNMRLIESSLAFFFNRLDQLIHFHSLRLLVYVGVIDG